MFRLIGLLCALIGITGSLTAQINDSGVRWVSLEEALAYQKENPKKILIEIYTDWCRERKMIPEANKRLVYKFGKEYPLRSRWNPETKKNYKVFTNCSFSISPPKEDEQPQIEEHKSLKDELGL